MASTSSSSFLSPSSASSSSSSTSPASPSPSPNPSSSSSSSSSLSASPVEEVEDHLRIIELRGYQFSSFHETLYWVLGLGTGLVGLLVFFWFPRLAIAIRYKRVLDLADADYIWVIAASNGNEFVPVEATSSSPMYQKPHLLYYVPLFHTARSIPLSERMIVFRHTRFLYSASANTFQRLLPLSSLPTHTLYERKQVGLREADYRGHLSDFGKNETVVVIQSIPAMLMQEVFHPFFVFQAYSVVLWCFEQYWIFAGCIAFIATVSIVTTLVETRRRWFALKELARFECEVHVRRNGSIELGSSADLIPGDIIHLPERGMLPADIALLDGSVVVNESMLTGESVPVIKTSVNLPSNQQSTLPVELGKDDRNTLYSATKILQLKPSSPGVPVLGIVVRSGYSTTKGALLLSMMYPRPSSFKFEEQSYKFIATLFGLALIGFVVSVIQLYRIGASPLIIVIRGLDLITIALPPALPLAMSIGTNFALLALKKQRLYCISPSRINSAGKVQTMCFDKTGTLTADGMEFKGVQPVIGNHFSNFQRDVVRAHASSTLNTGSTTSGVIGAVGAVHGHGDDHHSEHSGHTFLEFENESSVVHAPSSAASSSSSSSSPSLTALASTGNVPTSVPLSSTEAPLQGDIRQAMACCHSLANLDQVDDFNSSSTSSSGGEEGASSSTLIGDPLEVKMFEATHSALVDSGDLNGYLAFITVPSPVLVNETIRRYGVRVRFEFVPKLQRMSVVVEDLDTHSFIAFVKGSPEKMRSLCVADSIPFDYDEMLNKFAHQGYRVIAIAQKRMESPLPSVEPNELRDIVEQQLHFLGLIVLENKVKPESAPTLRVLRQALVRSIMVTGDNPLTAITVAKECELVEPGTRVFVSEITHDATIRWVDTDDANNTLDPVTLQPTHSSSSPSSSSSSSSSSSAHHLRDCPYELAVTGPAFRLLEEGDDEQLLQRVVLNGVIFARMTPEQKASLISHLQRLGLYTGMCGDGANDCAALKTAHIGVSLSQTEASIAAPFTYLEPNISCIPLLLCEGRSSLITSFQLFRYMAMYSLIQFTAVILCYFRGSVLSNWQYLYQDLWVVFPITIFMGDTPAATRLTAKRPSGNLLSATNCSNIVTHELINLLFQLAIFSLTSSASGYIDYSTQPDFMNDAHTWEATSLYYFSNFQYIVTGALFAHGHPWKQPVYKNWKLSAWWVLTLVSSLALLLSTSQPGIFREDDIPLPVSWRWGIFGFVLFNAVVSCVYELGVYPFLIKKYKHFRRSGFRAGLVYGRMKNVEGPNAKRYHVLRGEFEAGWTHSVHPISIPH